MFGEGRSPYAIRVVENALDILEAFGEEGGELGVTQLSTRLGLHKSKVFKLLATFEQRGYVERGQRSDRYRAGGAAYVVGRMLLRQCEWLRCSRPVMDYLLAACNETVYLAWADRHGFLLLDRVDSTHSVQVSSLIGKRYPVKLPISGRRVLKFLSAEGASGPVREINLADEVWLDRGVLGEEVISLTMPVKSCDGLLLGGLCLVAPEFRVSQERVERDLLPQLRIGGRMLAEKLGYFPQATASKRVS